MEPVNGLANELSSIIIETVPKFKNKISFSFKILFGMKIYIINR